MSAAARDKTAPADRAAWCSIARGTARRSCCRDSRTAVRRAGNIAAENARADRQRSRNRARQRFRRPRTTCGNAANTSSARKIPKRAGVKIFSAKLSRPFGCTRRLKPAAARNARSAAACRGSSAADRMFRTAAADCDTAALRRLTLSRQALRCRQIYEPIA